MRKRQAAEQTGRGQPGCWGVGATSPVPPDHRPPSLSAVGAVRVTPARLPPPCVGERPRSMRDVSLLPGAPRLT